MKNLLNSISQEEKNRILEMHQKVKLSEQASPESKPEAKLLNKSITKNVGEKNTPVTYTIYFTRQGEALNVVRTLASIGGKQYDNVIALDVPNKMDYYPSKENNYNSVYTIVKENVDSFKGANDPKGLLTKNLEQAKQYYYSYNLPVEKKTIPMDDIMINVYPFENVNQVSNEKKMCVKGPRYTITGKGFSSEKGNAGPGYSAPGGSINEIMSNLEKNESFQNTTFAKKYFRDKDGLKNQIRNEILKVAGCTA